MGLPWRREAMQRQESVELIFPGQRHPLPSSPTPSIPFAQSLSKGERTSRIRHSSKPHQKRMRGLFKGLKYFPGQS